MGPDKSRKCVQHDVALGSEGRRSVLIKCFSLVMSLPCFFLFVGDESVPALLVLVPSFQRSVVASPPSLSAVFAPSLALSAPLSLSARPWPT